MNRTHRALIVAFASAFVFGCAEQPPLDDGVTPISDPDSAADLPAAALVPSPTLIAAPTYSPQEKSAVLRWSAIPGAMSYSVFAGVDSDPPMLARTAGTEFEFAGLSECTTYFWRIEVETLLGRATSAVGSFSSPCASGVPGVPIGPVPNDGAVGQPRLLTLKWQPTGNASSYDIYLGRESSPPLLTSTAGTEFDISSQLIERGMYFWRVVARNGAMQTSSKTWSFIVGEDTSADSVLQYVYPQDGTIGVPRRLKFDWKTDAVVKSSEFYFGTDPENLTLVSASKKSEWMMQSGLQLGTTYYWRIIVETDRDRREGPTASFRTAIADRAPAAPAITAPTNGMAVGQSGGLLTWKESALADSYEIYLGTTTAPQKVATVTDAFYVIPNELEEGVYYWRVVAVNSLGVASSAIYNFIASADAPPGGGIFDDPQNGDEPGSGNDDFVEGVFNGICRPDLREVPEPALATFRGARISPNGLFVAISPDGGGDEEPSEILIYDYRAESTTSFRVRDSYPAWIASDGATLIVGTESALDPRDNNGTWDFYVVDHGGSRARWIEGGDARKSYQPGFVSIDGSSLLIYASPSDGRSTAMLFVDRESNEREIATIGPGGETLMALSGDAAISATGDFIAFPVGVSGGNQTAIYVRDMRNRSTELIGTEHTNSAPIAISADGRYVILRILKGSSAGLWCHDRQTGDRKLIYDLPSYVFPQSYMIGNTSFVYTRLSLHGDFGRASAVTFAYDCEYGSEALIMPREGYPTTTVSLGVGDQTYLQWFKSKRNEIDPNLLIIRCPR